MIGIIKKAISFFALISGLLILSFIYPTLFFYVNRIHGKPDLSIVIMLFLTHVILVGNVFIFGWAFNFVKSTKKHVLIAVTVISLFPTLYFGYGMYQNTLDWSFTVEKWKSHPQERVYMVDEMLKKYELRGRNREEVENLLGKPDQQKDDVVVYVLGDERALFSIDSEYLIIRYDQNEKVSNYSISVD